MVFQSIYELSRLLKNQWVKPSEIEEIQRRKLSAVLRHAYRNVDYYRRLFDSAGVKPEEIRSGNDLSQIPVTTRSQLQKLPLEEITSKEIRENRCLRVKTSGSTGRPLDIRIDQKDSKLRGAVVMRALLSNGYRLRDKGVLIGSLPIYHSNRWYRHLGVGRQQYILASDGIDEQIEQMREANPDIIQAVPSALRTVAEAVRQKRIKDIRPRIIVSGGEILVPQTRELINSTFGVKMVDFYSSWEFGNIAWECNQHEGYHINVDGLVVEVINDGRAALPGERGELVITSLNSYAMPLIRYKIGDIGILSDRRCSCGRNLSLLERVEGRMDDLIRLSNGRVVSPFTITAILRFIPGIVQFRLVQEKEDEFLVQLKRGGGFYQETIQNVTVELKRCLGAGITLKVENLNDIPCDPSGKLRSVISRVKP